MNKLKVKTMMRRNSLPLEALDFLHVADVPGDGTAVPPNFRI